MSVVIVDAKFPLGRLYATPGALYALEESGQHIEEFIQRHASGDWGELCDEDRQENERSLDQGYRLFSIYYTTLRTKLYVITEWDRSVTTLLLPEEY